MSTKTAQTENHRASQTINAVAFDKVMVDRETLLDAMRTIAKQCGPFAEVQPALDYATIGNIARAAIARATGK